ncbi:FAD-dependent oxidoreductase [Geodermatophilus obscurus]|uniref:GMC oxidoreductase n=1 Tax=Geodermatophilus obscurus (strain ATCC 25078 / DSM 43160 / JCM 3152 / CCUG 61914 / KCC A-0152 / KCTC 9177 / NBRC 13315 / NRRL B-3577 / G-20) TaxID=526225 RepID=D2S5Z0_GEOOG|nr:FAD-dependent oxidoreductase [Geodermatophilus obscurus]ADB73207.1 GMC oxidoreductase [Geodermatophilus obscurus DSM 43160]
MTSPPPDGAAVDVCVVGAGPVGLSLALEAARSGLQVLLVEAGHRTRKPSGTPLDETIATVLDPGVHAPFSATTRLGLGGTSWLWGGRCVPFELADLAPRDHVPFSGWPLFRSDIAPYEAEAAHYLDCGSAAFHADPVGGWDETVVRTTQLERWSRRPAVARRLGAQVLSHPGIAVVSEALVTGVVVDDTGTSVRHLRVWRDRREVTVEAAAYVLACGGVATTRLLLNTQRSNPALFGGPSGALGRYYMGHLTGSIASIVLTHPDDVADWGLVRTEDGTVVRRRFTLSEQAQQDHRLLNTAFYLGNLPFSDARHGSGALSLFSLCLAAPVLGRVLGRPETRRRDVGGGARDWRSHLRNLTRRPGRVIRDVAAVVRLRLLSPRRGAEFLLRTDTGAYALRYHAEQEPDPGSRITLNDRTGSDGLPGIDVDLRYSDQDVDSVLRAHSLLDEHLQTTGFGRLVYRHPLDQRAAAVRAQAMDGYHQIGTTRMSDDPQSGVVDADCRVHGTTNLYVASSSVFPTAGEANPTFMAVTLAVRLARHLADRVGVCDPASGMRRRDRGEPVTPTRFPH